MMETIFVVVSGLVFLFAGLYAYFNWDKIMSPSAPSEQKARSEIQEETRKEIVDEIDVTKSIFYGHYKAISFDNGWTHSFSYNDERLRFESKRKGVIQTCGDYNIQSIKKAKVEQGEILKGQMLRAFLDIYMGIETSRLYITDKKLINENFEFLEEVVWIINNEALPGLNENYYFEED